MIMDRTTPPQYIDFTVHEQVYERRALVRFANEHYRTEHSGITLEQIPHCVRAGHVAVFCTAIYAP